MPARRCSLHAINYPAVWDATKCVVCGGPTEYITNEVPDDDWQDKVATLLEQQAAEAEPLETLRADRVRVRVCGDYLCLNSDDVYQALKKVRLAPRTLIQVGAQTFEILYWRREPRREYIVRTFETTVTDEDIAGLIGG